MRLILDLILIAIILVSAWRGFKNGIIRGICGILAVIISLSGAGIISNAYSGEFSGMIQPFADGLIDGAVSDVLSDNKETLVTVRSSERGDVYTVCFAALREVGVAEDAAEAIAKDMAKDTDSVDQDMTAMLSEKVSDKLAYAAVVTVAFILIAIVFAVIGNLINLSFEIPGAGKVEPIAGTVLGIIKGIIIMYALATLVRYLGLALSDELLESTKLLSGVVNNNPVANKLGL